MTRSGKIFTRMMLSCAVLVGAGSGLIHSSEAKAQLIGACPSPIMPPPCIIFDGKKLGQIAQEHAQQVERLKDTIKQIQETKATAESIGGSVQGVLTLKSPDLNIAPGGGETFTTLTAGNFKGTLDSFSTSLYEDTGAGIDSTTATLAAREREEVAATADSLAMSLNAREYAKNSHKRMICLSRASQSSKDARGDWAINSQVRLEVLRQQAQRDQLLTTVLQGASVNATVGKPVEQGEVVQTGTTNEAPPVAPRSPAWEKRDELRTVEVAIRALTASIAIAQGVNQVRSDGKSVQERYQNSETRREQTLTNFRNRANAWSRGNGNAIVDATVRELNRIDTQMAALRNQPIQNLSGAFAERNIDVAALTANDVDPRQFLGTWGDPLKNKITLDMGNSLLRGSLDRYIDGDDDNDEYRKLLLEYNDARLEEAWMRTYSAEVGKSIDAVDAVAREESASLGYELTEEAAKQNLQQLIAKANQLGQEIQATGDPVPTQQAAQILRSIGNLVNAKP